jgi:hypothetical protein
MRTYEDICKELSQLRDYHRETSIKLNEEREKNKALTTELEWWRTTFGPKTLNQL